MNAVLAELEAPHAQSSAAPLRAGPSLKADVFHVLRRRAVLEGCKWDPQVGDVATLANFPLLLRSGEWRQLARWAEQLTAELIAAEREIVLTKPALLDDLGLPRAVCRALQAEGELTPPAARTVRFDFHFTTDGWQISEANSDVPGGFTEATCFTSLVAEHVAGAQPAGAPAPAWVEAIHRCVGDGGAVALLSAPGYMEDQQIMAYLARLLRERGCRAGLAQPGQLVWREDRAELAGRSGNLPLDVVVRFFQGEWLAQLPDRCGWTRFFRNGRTPVANPGIAVVSESKRFPLTWARLATRLPTWQRLLPETRDPREAPWRDDDAWLLKSAMCNTGDTVSVRAELDAQRWAAAAREVQRHPDGWVAQRRFTTLPLDTPIGPMFPCVGVYTVNGRACGAYARLARGQVVDFAAMDVALLVEDDET